MTNNTINLVGSYHRPFWFPFASVYVPVTPCVLDGSLSFLEMVWKLLKNLNDVNAATNANHTDILTLESQIETIISALDQKLDFLEVEFDDSEETITADKTFAEIAAAFSSKIILGRCGSMFYVCLSESENRPAAYQFYSLDGMKLDVLAVNSLDVITRTTVNLITSAGGTVDGALIVQTPTANGHAANKKYVDDQDAATLAAAKDYADSHDATTLQSAKDYADSHDATTLQSAKDYADANFVKTNGDSGNTYASRNTTELNFTDIPASPSTITISNLLAKLSRWYTEIKNKITRAEITNTGGVYKCSMTFADIYALFLEGQEVQLIYDDPLSTLEVSIMRTERYGPTSITFVGDNHTCTITSSDVITFS